METDENLPLAQTLPERLAEALSARITDGTYSPGERLTEGVLAKEFAVSHGPVRDALRILERAGLVNILPYRGAQIAQLDVQEVKELYQVRAALVGLRARWIAESSQRKAFAKQAEKAVKQLEALAENPDKGEEYATAALALNRSFTDNVSNRWLRGMLQSLSLQTARYTRVGLADPEHRRESARYWRRLLETIRAGDAEQAEKIASENSLASRDAAIRYLNSTTNGLSGNAEPDNPHAIESMKSPTAHLRKT
jgi:DNA-binding GntR family transcriptional regulator